MNMKWQVLVPVFFSSLSITCAMASDGTINFVGSILEQTCVVDIGTNKTMDVKLGSVAKTAFNGVGDSASVTGFTIKLKSCPESVTSAKVKFDGTADATDRGLLAIAGGQGKASGVAIRLMTMDKAPLGLNSFGNYAYTLAKDQENQLNFYAAYQSTSTTIKAGEANATSTFTVNYN
ncbi:fimbrial protein, partial [Citrobacter sp. Res13-Sevr-PEB04-36]|uniref:fimbrial protein n=1 Tax=Citrobacter sp. Res13-Sevr-PEB04-36 TaxID=2777960 RepID=UPI0018ACD029